MVPERKFKLRRRDCNSPSNWGAITLVCALLGVLLVPGAVVAQPSTPASIPNVLRIEVEGNKQVSTEQILRWFAVRPGDPYDQRRVIDALKSLTQKGRFSDAELEGEVLDGGIVLYIVVEEFLQIRELQIKGARKIKEDDLRPALQLRSRAFLTPWRLREDLELIAERYRDKGHFRVQVADSLIQRSDGSQDLLFSITEGPKASIKDIVFEGNEHASAKVLRKKMETSTDGILSGGDLKTDVLEKDFQAITGYYNTLGYLDARVLDHQLEVADNGKDLTISIEVDEGELYATGSVQWEGNKIFTDEEIAQHIQLVEGQPFNEEQYNATTTALYELYQDRGHFYFNAAPRRDIRDKTVNLHYSFDEGRISRLNHIRIVGNEKTHDKVLLREFRIFPGDVFNRTKLMRSIREIFQLGYFEDIVPNISPRSDSLVDIDLRVVERQTGQLGAGAGYSAVNAITGFIQMSETNFLGEGKRLSFRWEFSKRRNDVNFSYTQPWVMDGPTTLTVDLFNSSGRSRLNSFYRVKRTGGALRIGRRLQFLDFTTAFWRFRAESLKFTDFADAVPDSSRAALARDRDRFTTGLTLRRNSTDNPFFPSRGSEAEWTTSLAGTFLGGDESFLRNDLELTWYQRVGLSKFTFMLKSNFGFLKGLEGRQVPNDELFRLGGVFSHGVRGYDEFEIVPEGNVQFVGGRIMSTIVSEIRYPFSNSVHASMFFDAGNTWNSLEESDLSNLKKGAGVGIRVQVPMLGLLGFDYGYGFDRLDRLGNEADRWKWHFRFGNFF